MNHKIHFLVCLLATGSLHLGIAAAQDKNSGNDEAPKITLKVGDPAPPLAPHKWIKGEPVTSFEKDKIYIVEFWATWCVPCVAAIPHLTELQAMYKGKGVIVIGQNISDKQDKVPEFVAKMGDKMNYRVALDDVSKDEKGVMNSTWMAASGQKGIPASFLVGKDGRIAWIGFPKELDGVLEQVIAGTYDLGKQMALVSKQEKLEAEVRAALKDRNFDHAIKLADALAALSPQMATEIIAEAFQSGLQTKQYDTAYKFGAQLLEIAKDDPETLHEIATPIVFDMDITKRDLNLAEKALLRAAELTQEKDVSVLDTLAAVHNLKGDYAKAVEWGTKAAANATNDNDRKYSQEMLEEYKAKLNKDRVVP